MRLVLLTALTAVVLLPLVGAGCRALTGADDDLIPATLIVGGEADELGLHSDPVVVPDSVSPGREFEVTVLTWHTPPCEEPATTEVTADSDSAVIRPFNRRTGVRACQSRGATTERVLAVTAGAPGTFRVVVHGVSGRGEPVRVERAVEVK